jgi:nucleolar protein 56
MREVAPNTLKLTGSTLGARLIAATGSIDNLAKRSASTIQVLGAEKALFRSLRSGSRPPKHGLIFQHNEVHQAPRWQRGKIARALAGKIAIAARLDAYGGEYRGPELCQDFEKRVKEIQERYPQPHARERRRDGRS